MSDFPIFSKCTKFERLDISSGIRLLLSGEDIVAIVAGCGQLEPLVLGSGWDYGMKPLEADDIEDSHTEQIARRLPMLRAFDFDTKAARALSTESLIALGIRT